MKNTIYGDVSELLKDCSQAFKPPQRLTVSEASEKYVKVNGEEWSNDVAPYMVEPCNNLTSRDHDGLVFVGPARSAKTQGLIDNLITFGAHSQFHCNLKALDEEDLFDQIVGSKNIIENILSTKVDFFAYPGGGYTKKVLDIVGSNFKGGVKDRLNGDYDTDPFKLARVNIDNQIKNFKDFLILLISTKYLKNK